MLLLMVGNSALHTPHISTVFTLIDHMPEYIYNNVFVSSEGR